MSLVSCNYFNSFVFETQKLQKIFIFEVQGWNKINFFRRYFCRCHKIIKTFRTSVLCCLCRRVVGLYTQKTWGFNIYIFSSINSLFESPGVARLVRFFLMGAIEFADVLTSAFVALSFPESSLLWYSFF